MYSLYNKEYRIFKPEATIKKGAKVDRSEIEEMNQFKLHFIHMHGNVTRKLSM
jgi:hypothetical protein